MSCCTFKFFDKKLKIDYEPAEEITENVSETKFKFNIPLFAVSFIGDGNLVVGGGGGSASSGLKSGIFCISTNIKTSEINYNINHSDNSNKNNLLWAVDLKNSVPFKIIYQTSLNKLIFSLENAIYFSKLNTDKNGFQCESIKTTNKEFSTKKFVLGPTKTNPKNIAVVCAENVVEIFKQSDSSNNGFIGDGSIVSAKVNFINKNEFI